MDPSAVDGLLLLHKPQGPTSHDLVAQVRRCLGQRRVGHSGTLDPMASGLLPLVLGRATRLVRFPVVSLEQERVVGTQVQSRRLVGVLPVTRGLLLTLFLHQARFVLVQ